MKRILVRLAIVDVVILVAVLVACLVFRWTSRVEFGTVLFLAGIAICVAALALGSSLTAFTPKMDSRPTNPRDESELALQTPVLYAGLLLGVPLVALGVAITWNA